MVPVASAILCPGKRRQYSLNEHPCHPPRIPDDYPIMRASPKPSVPRELKAEVLIRDRKICRVCGQCPKDHDPYTHQKARITVGFCIPPEHGGSVSANNLRAVCSTCAEGLKGIPYLPRPSFNELVRLLTSQDDSILEDRATRDDQQVLLDWLLKKFWRYHVTRAQRVKGNPS